MEFAPRGPIDRLFENPLPTPSQIEAPEIGAPTDAQGFKLKGWHLVAAVGVLGLAGFVIWRIQQAKKKKYS